MTSMEGRIPLSVVLDAPGRRHAIPHRTFTADASSAFFHYLDSDDTRLPDHPQLVAHARPAEDYDTFVGEEVWHGGEHVDDAPASPGRFDDVVQWVIDTLDQEEATWTADGVVLCGRYVVADDCTWAVPSRSPALFTAREVFTVMRSSCKFLADVHAQRTSRQTRLEFSLVKAMAGSAAKEMCAFIPYTLTAGIPPPSSSGSVLGDEVRATLKACPLYDYIAISQRATDLCLPALMTWTEAEHARNYDALRGRLEQAALMPRACAADPDFLPHLVRRMQRWWRRRGRAVAVRRARPHKSSIPRELPLQELIVLLSVDLLFEAATLPVHVLSAKARLFVRNSLLMDDRDGCGDAAPLLCDFVASSEDGEFAYSSDDMQIEPNDSAEEDSSDEAAYGTADTTFFRLIRDTENWNRYVTLTRDRLTSPSTTTPSAAEAAGRYCIVASDPSDLVCSADTLTKRGLPLEVMRPELLQGNPSAAAFLQGLREAMLSADTANAGGSRPKE